MSPAEVSDRLEIQDLLVRYCYALDRGDWNAFAQVFTADAIIDFTAFGGPRCGVAPMREFLQGVLAQMQAAQHTISTMLIDLAGDEARVQTAATVPMVMATADCGSQILFSGLWYHDHLLRTAAGWRIHERVQQKSWSYSVACTA